MNKLIKSICVLSTIAMLVAVQSCKKPKKLPDDPCKNAIVVEATQPEMYIQGHFSYADNNSGSNWLYANNWNEYANKVVPGRQYKIAYTEVKCKDDWCGTTITGFARGGCFIVRRCIVINCLNEVKGSGCFGSVVNPPDYNDENTSAISVAGISGNSLNAKVGFSGCSADDMKSFQLYLNYQPERCATPPMGNDVFMAKVVNTFKGYTCMAYFEKDICFDLSALRKYYALRGAPLPATVTIRVMTRDNSYKDFTYNP